MGSSTHWGPSYCLLCLICVPSLYLSESPCKARRQDGYLRDRHQADLRLSSLLPCGSHWKQMVSKQPVMFTAASIKDKSPTIQSLISPTGLYRGLQTAALMGWGGWISPTLSRIQTHSYLELTPTLTTAQMPLLRNNNIHIHTWKSWKKKAGACSKCPPPSHPDMLHLLQLNKHVIWIYDDTLQPAPRVLNIMASLWSPREIAHVTVNEGNLHCYLN